MAGEPQKSKDARRVKKQAKQKDTGTATPGDGPPSERRNFMVELAAGTIGAVVGLVPLVAGAVVFLNPLRSKSGSADADEGNFVRITTLDSIPADGRPYRFPVVTEKVDAWSVYPASRVGSVYLRLPPGETTPTALTATCPHLGCMVDYKPEINKLFCPCHNSTFEQDGTRANPTDSPSPRDMDTLEVEVRGGDEVWVNFKNFRGGTSQKIEV